MKFIIANNKPKITDSQGKEIENHIDLHIHSIYSDGLYTVEQIVERAKKYNLKAISITDHDTLAGQAEARRLAKEAGIEYVTGMEISSAYKNYDVHILGYFIDDLHPDCIEYQKNLNASRLFRAEEMVRLMALDGVKLDIEHIKAKVPDHNIVRPHIAEELIELGYCKDLRQAFQNYIGNHCKYYVKKDELDPVKAIEMVHRAGGVAILAHPFYLKNDLETLRYLISCGLDGLETYHSLHSASDIRLFEKICAESGIVQTGGSDCHGGRKNGEILLGEYKVPAKLLDLLKVRLKEKTEQFCD